MIRRPPRSTQGVSSAASDVYKRQAADAALVGIRFSMAAFDAATTAPDPTSAEAVPACATARDAADAAPLARSAALLLANAADSTTLECAWLTASDNLDVQPCGPPIWVLCGRTFQVGLARGFVRRGNVRSRLLATRISLDQVPRNIRTRSSIQDGRGSSRASTPQPEAAAQRRLPVVSRTLSDSVVYIYKCSVK